MRASVPANTLAAHTHLIHFQPLWSSHDALSSIRQCSRTSPTSGPQTDGVDQPPCSVRTHTAVWPSHCARPGAQHDRSVNRRWLSVHCVLVMDHAMAHGTAHGSREAGQGRVQKGKEEQKRIEGSPQV